MIIMVLIVKSRADKRINECNQPRYHYSLFTCLAYIPRFYFDKSTSSCKEFIWGGNSCFKLFKIIKKL